jgi:hypothetical protein
MKSDEPIPPSSFIPHLSKDSGWATAAMLDRQIGEFIIGIREWAGLHIKAQRDPGGRIVSYGYHCHEPNEHGVCENWVVYGYTTHMAALIAGLKAKFGTDQSSDVDGEPGDRLVTVCPVKR